MALQRLLDAEELDQSTEQGRSLLIVASPPVTCEPVFRRLMASGRVAWKPYCTLPKCFASCARGMAQSAA